mmetsp:Transcript_10981/g.19392  ORF Transcript_10981/g.19392 Transcript_10981/m.19392 type:complete len:746 (-) Transcript_10981:167-2404(-)
MGDASAETPTPTNAGRETAVAKAASTSSGCDGMEPKTKAETVVPDTSGGAAPQMEQTAANAPSAAGVISSKDDGEPSKDGSAHQVAEGSGVEAQAAEDAQDQAGQENLETRSSQVVTKDSTEEQETNTQKEKDLVDAPQVEAPLPQDSKDSMTEPTGKADESTMKPTPISASDADGVATKATDETLQTGKDTSKESVASLPVKDGEEPQEPSAADLVAAAVQAAGVVTGTSLPAGAVAAQQASESTNSTMTVSDAAAKLAAVLAPTAAAVVNAANAATPMRTFPAYNGGDGMDSASGRWSKEEDEQLRKAVGDLGARNWKRIASNYLGDKRTDVQCLHRWQKVLKPGLVKGPWGPEEDATIIECMAQGITRWSDIAKKVPGRIGKQCRERWFNHLDPSIKKSEWTFEEDQQLIIGQATLGNKWSQIAKLYLPGRPENAVKNRWNAATRRRRTGEFNSASSPALLAAAAKAGSSSSAALAAANAALIANGGVNTVSGSGPVLGTAKVGAGLPASGNGATAPLSGSKRKTGPLKRRAETFAEGLEGLAGLCATFQPEVENKEKKAKKPRLTKEERQALKQQEREAKKRFREQEREAKRKAKELEKENKRKAKLSAKEAAKEAAKSRKRGANKVDALHSAALNGAAALLAAAGELNDMPVSKRSKRGSSFVASRPDLSAPSVSTKSEAQQAQSMETVTPNWSGIATSEKNISPPSKVNDTASSAASALEFLSALAHSRPKRGVTKKEP